MAPPKKTPSLQDILKRRQRSDFVGREEQIALFRQNLALPLDDDRRRFIFNVAGQGSVGKTWLLRRFRQLAGARDAITAWTDEAEEDVPEVMGRIAEQFEEQGYDLESFSERYRVYRQKRRELEADPDAPQGFPAFVGRTLIKGGLGLARGTPVGAAAAEFVDEETLASLGGEVASFVAQKIGNKDEVRLVLEPIHVLTPLFLKDLREIAEEHTIALFFDTYERTGDFLDLWLRGLLEGRHGEVPANIVLTVAGRDPLDRDQWSPFEGLIARLPLDPFTKEEALDYLNRQGVTNAKVVDVILQLSSRLPLLVATLASETPDDPGEVDDPSGEAVERFLKWVQDPEEASSRIGCCFPASPEPRRGGHYCWPGRGQCTLRLAERDAVCRRARRCVGLSSGGAGANAAS